MKVKPVLDALEQRSVEVLLVHTGQHYDTAMSQVFFDELGIRSPDIHLEVGSGTHASQTGQVMIGFEPVVAEFEPDAVVVVGDVNSTLAAGLVGAKSGSLVAHVEAGLRSRDWGMPEEINRVVTDRISDYLFAPSPDAVDNLRSEGYRDDQVHLVGNVMVDTLLANLERAQARPVISNLGLETGGFALVTLHRPANVDDPEIIGGLLDVISEISVSLPIVFPVHPRTRSAIGDRVLAKGIRLVDPVGYLDFVALESGARVVLTDSGGVQEETTVLGIPCLTLRENTERPITVTHGTNTVVGRDPRRIMDILGRVLDHGVVRRRPELWDGHAGERIADVICDGGLANERRRPTELNLSGG